MARLIDACAFGRWINDERLAISDNRSKTETYDTLGMVIDMLDEMPTVDAVPVVHGEWINRKFGFWEACECSICHVQFPTTGDGINYCLNCGAYMRGTVNE